MSDMDISLLGTPANIDRKKQTLKATYSKNGISGSVIFIDHFGNLITNITRKLFDDIGKGRPFNIYIRSSLKLAISEISTGYNIIEGDKQYYLALFNSFDILEIAQKKESLAQLESVDVLSGVEVEFIDGILF
jgi:S-adenosylmethionine hydrolase